MIHRRLHDNIFKYVYQMTYIINNVVFKFINLKCIIMTI